VVVAAFCDGFLFELIELLMELGFCITKLLRELGFGVFKKRGGASRPIRPYSGVFGCWFLFCNLFSYFWGFLVNSGFIGRPRREAGIFNLRHRASGSRFWWGIMCVLA
jgi:hypothetical protein